MIGRVAALLLAILIPGQAVACPEPIQGLLFHSCWSGGQAEASILLLPEDDPAKLTGNGILVTGAYTSREKRKDGRTKPVGLFMRDGEVINRNLGRMDGILIIDPSRGEPAIYHRQQVPAGEEVYDLTMLDQRSEFIRHASARNFSVMQSHLLIIDGKPDVTPREDAPEYRRRLLFTDAYGFGIWQSPAPATLHKAALQIVEQLSPVMAINLDMGSYDFCERISDGIRVNCSLVPGIDTKKLSNMLFLSTR